MARSNAAKLSSDWPVERRWRPSCSCSTAARTGSASSSISEIAWRTSASARPVCPASAATPAASESSWTWSTPASSCASGTRAHSSSAASKCWPASTGANTRCAAWPARTDASSARGCSWARYQCQASRAGSVGPGRVAPQLGAVAQRLGDPLVQRAALAGEQIAVDGLADERVAERVRAGRRR
jgi:hypothetical protein